MTVDGVTVWHTLLGVSNGKPNTLIWSITTFTELVTVSVPLLIVPVTGPAGTTRACTDVGSTPNDW